MLSVEKKLLYSSKNLHKTKTIKKYLVNKILEIKQN